MENEPERTILTERAENKYISFALYVLAASSVVAAVALSLYFVWYAADLLLLVFAGILISILLRGVALFVCQKTGISRNASVAIVSIALIVFVVLLGWLMVGRIGTQVVELQQQLPQAVESAKEYQGQYEWAREVTERLPSMDDWLASRGGTILTRLTGFASSTLGAFLNVIVVVILGLYIAFQPEVYSGAIKRLLPIRFRDRADEILSAIDEALWNWLGGRFLLMLVNAALTGVGLWVLGVPLALTLGLLSGVLNFIPTFGPWIAAIPAVLIAFLQSPLQAFYVVLLYLVLQSLDGYVFTPLVDRKSVEMPPVLTITAMLLLGIIFGFVGLMLASPLMAVAIILVRMLYIEDVLGEDASKPSET